METSRPGKIDEKNLNRIVSDAVDCGTVRLSIHASERMGERLISFETVKGILKGGTRKRARDKFNHDTVAWNYVYEGPDPDKMTVRVVVAIDMLPDRSLVVVVTAYEVGQSGLEGDKNGRFSR